MTEGASDGSEPPIPPPLVEAAVRLTRRARRSADADEAAAYRRDRESRLATHGYRARTRTDGDGAVLVLYPDEWVTDGTVDLDAVEDTGRAIERPLEGPGDPESWDEVDARNRELVAAVADRYGPVHGANASAFADFMGNHYARRMATADEAAVREFLGEYYPRNAWPSAEERAAVEESLRLVFKVADRTPPPDLQSGEGPPIGDG